ncbi:MAG: hypothetical protein ACPGVU_10205 [Limisphaerales bacterium]
MFVHYFEKRTVWPYADEWEHGGFSIATNLENFRKRVTAQGVAAGFRSLGDNYDNKGKRYILIYSFYISPDNTTLVMIGAGTVIGIPISAMDFSSRTVIGKVQKTVTSQNAVEKDLSGLWQDGLITTNDFHAASSFHSESCAGRPETFTAFTPGRELEEYRELLQTRVAALHGKGLIRYRKRDKSVWSYSIWGSIKVGIIQQIIGVVRLPRSIFRGERKRSKPTPPPIPNYPQ